MNWVDFVIILALLTAVIRGWRAGLIQLVLTFAAFLAGLVAGSWLIRHTVPHFPNQLVKAFTLLLVELSFALVSVIFAERLSPRLKIPTPHLNLRGINNSFGSILAALFTLITIWLIASVFSNASSYGIGRSISQSSIINGLDSALPAPPDVFSKLEKIVDPNGFPDVFLGLEPQHTTVSPKNKVNNQMVLKDKGSIVKVQGAGCGTVVSGTGFVVAKGIVVTSAHVLAGVSRPQIVDKSKSYWATPIAFDPDIDMAVLKVKGLPDPPLNLSNKILPDISAATLMGFARGGPLVIEDVAAIGNLTALGRNIYNAGEVNRDIYVIQGKIEAGDSGGPLVAPDGTVAGVIFGRSLVQDNVGYALLIDQFRPMIKQASLNRPPVVTGVCTQGLE